ncbi:hypothetical protein BRADI_5g14523v3 [Brachypodium distachyon]|uniref:Uncharacterized protein n=1 Tax=Brachypodium distachyon TaxID=15368 RepID=A0A2K2CH76_BRADI|nr:hypothetical protein BRADI_5g14523v3 [Brachypodium distachyon]
MLALPQAGEMVRQSSPRDASPENPPALAIAGSEMPFDGPSVVCRGQYSSRVQDVIVHRW